MGDILGNRVGSILLARKPRFTDSRNNTTATAELEDGYTLAVSFWVAQPPELSLFSIHFTDKHAKLCLFSVQPRVVGADGPFVLFRAAFKARRKFFLYKAGAGDAPPSLEWIPSPFPDGEEYRRVRELGILGRHGVHYLLAALRDSPDDNDDGYQLRIYSSETGSWSARTLRNPCPGVDRVVPDKVITLLGQDQGLLGWVDLSHGMLVCNIPLLLLQHQDQPPGAAVSFIPLPETLPGNRYKLKYPIPPTKKMKTHPMVDEPCHSVSWFRDLTCVDGVLKFIEMENHPTTPEKNKDDSIIYDSDLIKSLKRKAVDGNAKLQLSSFRDAWRAVTWTRKLVSSSSSSSSNFWRQTCAAHVAHIKGQQLAFGEHYSAFPILSPDNGILYLKSLLEPSNLDGFVVALDIGNKSLKAIAPYYLPDYFCYNHHFDPQHPFRASTLSRHLDMTNPGIQVSAYREMKEARSSASETSEPMATFQSQLAAKLKRARNSSESITQKNPRISQVHPVENNMPQLHKWDAPPPGHSLWPHQNNLPPQQCFNKPDGPRGPGYASLAPVHGRHNYQPLRPPSKHHEAPQPCFNNYHGASYHEYSQQLSAPNLAHTGYDNYRQQLPPTLELPIGASWQPPPPGVQHQPIPREAPQPCFNNYHGASYHGYSQQLSAPNLAHTGYDSYRQQLPPTLELPIGASWQPPPPGV